MRHFLKLCSLLVNWKLYQRVHFALYFLLQTCNLNVICTTEAGAFIMAKTSFGWLAHIVNKSILCNVVCSIAYVANCHTFLLNGY